MLTLITLNGVYALLDVAIINPTQKKSFHELPILEEWPQ
jgi:hypothetical protein